MNKGIEILLARMDSHPQEFTQSNLMLGRYGRWTTAIEQVCSISSPFTQKERDAVINKLRELELEEFTRTVMKKLLDDPEGAVKGEDTVQVRRPNPYKYLTPTWAAQQEPEPK